MKFPIAARDRFPQPASRPHALPLGLLGACCHRGCGTLWCDRRTRRAGPHLRSAARVGYQARSSSASTFSERISRRARQTCEEVDMRHFRKSIIIGAFLLATALPAGAQTPTTIGDPDAGQAFALKTCTPCHVVSSGQGKPRRAATAADFQAIADTKAMTASALHAFLSSPHPTMPSLVLSRQEEKDVIAYILSLRH